MKVQGLRRRHGMDAGILPSMRYSDRFGDGAECLVNLIEDLFAYIDLSGCTATWTTS